VVFLDPPYDLPDGAVRGIVEGLRRDGWLAAGALVVVERASRGGEWVWPDGVEPVRSRRYGEGTLWYGRAADPAGRAGPVEDPGG
jgi:16S rRNA (guanine966-N2)-methyltransferase